MSTMILQAGDRLDSFLNGPFSLALTLFAIIAAVPAFILTLVAQEAPIVGWLAISLALTVAMMVRRPRG